MKKITLAVFILALSIMGCEKDDICDANTPTTPRLVIGFYDILNQSVAKNVTNLQVLGQGMVHPILFNGAETTNANTISVPLRTDGTATTYRFILNTGNSNLALVDEDIIKFNYNTQQLFVSRACGYKTIFKLDPTTPYTHTDVVAVNQKWIKFISVEKNNIANENETHIKIFF